MAPPQPLASGWAARKLSGKWPTLEILIGGLPPAELHVSRRSKIVVHLSERRTRASLDRLTGGVSFLSRVAKATVCRNPSGGGGA